MKTHATAIAAITLALLTLFSCRKGDEPAPAPTGGPGQGVCDAARLPVVMCHGMLASGDTWAGQAKRFIQNGHCGDRVFVHDRNTISGSGLVAQLDAFIDQVLQQTGATQVELVGHSAGGSLGYDYLAAPERAAKVAHYVHVGSGSKPGPAGPDGSVPTMNIWSPDDAVVAGADIPGAENVQLAGKDHYEVATSAETFAAMYTFFRGEAPAQTQILADGARTVGGRVVTFGENAPLADTPVRVFRVDPATGARLQDDPDHSFTTAVDGTWGTFPAQGGAYYEFEVSPSDGRRVHYYREPFSSSDKLVYLRVMPPPSSLAGLLLASLPSNDAQAVLTLFTASQAVIAGRDLLAANGLDLATPQFAEAANSTIAYFLYDENNDGNTGGTPAGLFGSFPFLSGVDMFFAPGGTASFTFNGRTLNVRNWPSASEGITVAVFD